MIRRTARSGIAVLLIGFLVMFLSSSIKNVYQVNVRAISQSFHIDRSEISLAGALFMLVTGVGAVVAGLLSDRVGPKRTIVVGSLFAGLAFTTSALAPSYLLFLTMYGAVAALALAAMQYVPMSALVDAAFSQKAKGLAYAILTNGVSVGFIVLSPLWVWLNLHYSWKPVFLWTGLVVMVPLAALVAYMPETPQPGPQAEMSKVAVRWGEVIRSRPFYLVTFAFFGCGVNMSFIDNHLMPMMQGLSMAPAVDASTLSLLGIFELIGGLVVGLLAARMSYRLLLSGLYFMRAIAVFLLLATQFEFQFPLFAAIFGMTYLGTVIITSLYCLKLFGEKLKSTVFGIMFFVHQTGGALAATLGGWVFDHFGDYHLLVVVTALASVLSAFLAFIIPSDARLGVRAIGPAVQEQAAAESA